MAAELLLVCSPSRRAEAWHAKHATAAKAAAIEASGLTPLAYLLSVMRRRWADSRPYRGLAAAPYVHPRMSPAEPMHPNPDFVPLAERLKAYARRDAIEAAIAVVELKHQFIGQIIRNLVFAGRGRTFPAAPHHHRRSGRLVAIRAGLLTPPVTLVVIHRNDWSQSSECAAAQLKTK